MCLTCDGGGDDILLHLMGVQVAVGGDVAFHGKGCRPDYDRGEGAKVVVILYPAAALHSFYDCQ